MKFTQVPSTTFQQIQLNAGILLSDFTPATGTMSASNIIGATSGGVNFTATPEFLDFGDGIDNVPANTKELKKLDYYNVQMTGTFVTVTATTVKKTIGAADISSEKITPRKDLSADDFDNIWWVGDYSDKNSSSTGGFIAIKMMNVLSTGGFQIQSTNKGKGTFAFTFQAHYSLNAQDVVPFEVYVHTGTDYDTTLSALTIGSLELTPSFEPGILNYTATTTNSTDTVTATASDNTATVAITNGSTSVTSGSSASWSSGGNALTIKVTKSTESTTYTVVVTKEAGE